MSRKRKTLLQRLFQQVESVPVFHLHQFKYFYYIYNRPIDEKLGST